MRLKAYLSARLRGSADVARAACRNDVAHEMIPYTALLNHNLLPLPLQRLAGGRALGEAREGHQGARRVQWYIK